MSEFDTEYTGQAICPCVRRVPIGGAAMSRRWYVVDPEDGLEFFDTSYAAETRARECMASWRSVASDNGEWVEEIGELEWGEVICHGRAVCTKSEPDPNSEYGDTLEDWELIEQMEGPR